MTVILDQKTTDRLKTGGPVELAGPDGVPFGTLTPLESPGIDPDIVTDDPVWSAEEIAGMKRRMLEGGPTRPSEEVYLEVFGENWRTRDHNAERAAKEATDA